MRITLFSIGLLFLSFSLSAQVGTSPATTSGNRHDNGEIMNQFFKGIKRNNQPTEVDGSPYLYNDYKSGTLKFPGGKEFSTFIKYNVLKETIEVKIDNEEYQLTDDEVDVDFKNRTFTKYTYEKGDNKGLFKGYFEVLNPDSKDQELKLLLKPYIYVKRGKAAAAMQKATPPKYVLRTDYYLKFPEENKAIQVQTKSKDFLRLFKGHSLEEIEKFVDSNRLKPRKEDDLIEIVRFYNNI